jgi:hypothetical protein
MGVQVGRDFFQAVSFVYYSGSSEENINVDVKERVLVLCSGVLSPVVLFYVSDFAHSDSNNKVCFLFYELKHLESPL